MVSFSIRHQKRSCRIGDKWIGGNHPVLVQSMCNVRTVDVAKVLSQIDELVQAGCELIRVSVPDYESAAALKLIVKSSPLPIIADIHFNHELALLAIEAGVAKIRINPGNIGTGEKIRYLAASARDAGIPIRVGANAGSLPLNVLDKYGGPSAEAMVEACLGQAAILERCGFENIVVSLKASDVFRTIEANRLISEKVNYPVHLGVTEAGTLYSGMIKSAIGIGALLLDGIGDTLRVSLSAHPKHEIYAGWEILQHLMLRQRGLRIVSCPGCARTEIDVNLIAAGLENEFQNVSGLEGLTVAVMGCAVNGPGEAKEADMGIAGLPGGAVFFKGGKVIGKIDNEPIEKFMIKAINAWKNEKGD